MRLALKLGGHVFEGGHFKTKRVVGISSHRPTNRGFHNLLFDIDGKPSRVLRHKADYWAKSPQGYHCIIFGNYDKRRAFNELLSMECDEEFAIRGFHRGYWFLQSYKPLPLHLREELSFMEIERVAKNYNRVHKLAIGQRGNHRGRVLGVLGVDT